MIFVHQPVFDLPLTKSSFSPQALIENQLGAACKQVYTSVTSLLDKLPASVSSDSDESDFASMQVTSPNWADRHISAFVWQESSLDLPTSAFLSGRGRGASATRSDSSMSGLTMKASGFTPGVAQ